MDQRLDQRIDHLFDQLNFLALQIKLLDAKLERKLDAILDILTTQGELTMADLSRIQSAVVAETTVVGSVKTLLASLAAQLKAASGDQATVDAIADQMVALNQTLADAVTANTPASPTPATPPTTA